MYGPRFQAGRHGGPAAAPRASAPPVSSRRSGSRGALLCVLCRAIGSDPALVEGTLLEASRSHVSVVLASEAADKFEDLGAGAEGSHGS